MRIKYFGILAELTGCHEEKMKITSGTISELINVVFKKHPALKGNDFQVAQNKIIVSAKTEVDGTEIAFLPPFSGG